MPPAAKLTGSEKHIHYSLSQMTDAANSQRNVRFFSNNGTNAGMVSGPLGANC
jgi:hypothetical protein